MTEPHMIQVDSIQREGIQAALAGTHMSAREAPLGFTFVPYKCGSAERWNFLDGCVRAYFSGDEQLRGELSQ